MLLLLLLLLFSRVQFSDSIKHVEINRHFIKANVDGNLIRMPFILTSRQVTCDIHMKGL